MPLAPFPPELLQVTRLTAFGSLLAEYACTHTRAHGVQVWLGPELAVLGGSGRGLALSDGALAARALHSADIQQRGMWSAFGFGKGVLEFVGADIGAVTELAQWRSVLALALEGVQAREAQQGRGRVTETLAQLAARIGGSLNLPEVLTATAQSAALALGFERALVGLFDELGSGGGFAQGTYTHGFEADFRGEIGVGPESFARLMTRGEVIVYDHDRDAPSPLAAGLREFAPQLALIAPLKARGRPLGILYADTRTRRSLSDNDETLLLALAEQASLAIDNARLYAEETRKRQVAEALREAGAALSRSLNLAETLQSALGAARSLFGADACAVHELQEDGRILSIRSALGLSSEFVLGSRSKVGAGVTGRAVETRQAAFVRDNQLQPQSGGSRYTRRLLAEGRYPFRGVLSLPLFARGHVFGGLSLYYAAPLPLGAEELALAQVFAAQAALAIENARLYEEEVSRERESALLLELSSLLKVPEPAQLQEAARLLTLALGAERGALVLRQEGGQWEAYPYALTPDSERLDVLSQQLGRGPRPLTRRSLFAGSGAQAGSGLLAPIKLQEQLLGYFYADQVGAQPPSERWLRLARIASEQVAQSLGHARLLEALEREEARYRLLAYSAHDLIMALDTAGRVTYANPASVRLLGELQGLALRPLLSESSLPAFEKACETCLRHPEQGGRCEITLHGLERDLRLEVRLSAVQISVGQVSVEQGSAGGVEGLLLVARDISELQTLAAEITRRSQELEAASHRQGQLREFLALFTQAQEEERRRISRELHDDTAQVLVAIGRRLGTLGRQLSQSGHPEQAERAADIREDLNGAIESVRRFARNLRPSVLDDLGLLPALEWLAEQATTPTRLEVQGHERRLGGMTELTIFRVVQEALGNVDKHAGAASAAVRVVYEPAQVTVTISDDGRGLDSQEAQQRQREGRMGLLGLRERVALAGGELQVVSEAGEGTQLSFVLEE